MLRDHFDHVDRDGNGMIDRSEFAVLLRKLGLNRAEDVVELAFAEIDKNGNGTIDFKEFSSWWQGRGHSGDEATSLPVNGLTPDSE